MASLQKRLLSVKEAAKYLSIQPNTLYHWICRREIPFVKVGKKVVRLDIRQLDRWINKQTVKTIKGVQTNV